jgi:hypothetical protein
MAGGDGVRSLSTTNDVNRIEAPVTWKAYLICAFASFGGIFFGYDVSPPLKRPSSNAAESLLAASIFNQIG